MGRHVGKHSPPLVKLFENGRSKWTGAIFGILDVLLSLPEGKTVTAHGMLKQVTGSASIIINKIRNVFFIHLYNAKAELNANISHLNSLILQKHILFHKEPFI